MKILEMRPYDKARDEPRTGWDAFSIENAIEDGKQLYVDQFGDIWTAGQREYVGRIRKERDYDSFTSTAWKPGCNGQRAV